MIKTDCYGWDGKRVKCNISTKLWCQHSDCSFYATKEEAVKRYFDNTDIDNPDLLVITKYFMQLQNELEAEKNGKQ